MLTVKKISMRGDELVYPASAVYFDAGLFDTAPESEKRSRVRFDTPGCAERSFDDGTVFVMNQHGATVSRWDLGASPVPLNEKPDAVHTQTRRAPPPLS